MAGTWHTRCLLSTAEIDGASREVNPGDAILIPPGAWHQIRALEPLRVLCCCAPPSEISVSAMEGVGSRQTDRTWPARPWAESTWWRAPSA
ncbi:MAG: cupin domain-containing protein [Akkermansiaceae bacterium]|nr:cupin domain-containing protein [Akkermansiaceae bacterium]